MEKTNRLGWVKLHRQLLEWEWIGDSQAFHLFNVLVLLANHKEAKWEGKTIERGCLITSIASLSTLTKIPTRSIRTILNKLEKSGEIAKQTTNKYTIITICKYDSYQSNETEEFLKLPNNCQTTAKQLPTNKNDKKEKKENNLSTATPDGDHFNFNTPEKITIEQELDIEIFWNTLLGIHKSESDKGLFNKKLVKKQKQIINGFTKDEREKILEWFKKYKSQLEIAGTWVSTFFQDNKTIDEIANYFRSIKDVKKPTPKYESNFQKKNTRVDSLDQF